MTNNEKISFFIKSKSYDEEDRSSISVLSDGGLNYGSGREPPLNFILGSESWILYSCVDHHGRRLTPPPKLVFSNEIWLLQRPLLSLAAFLDASAQRIMQSPVPSNYPLSIVIPVYNEEPVLPALFTALEKVRTELVKAYGSVEIVLVNDGSKDKSWQLMSDYCRHHPNTIGVNLSRNFGHQLCLVAGLETARGEAVVSMDADLQDPPEVIVQMMDTHRQGYDVVYATRRERGNETFTKRFTAHFFYLLIEKLSGVPIPRNTGDFRLLSRRALTELSRLRETHHFLRGLVPWIGFPQTQVFYDRADRAAGETHYPLRKMMRFAFDGIASMSAMPLRLAYVFSLLLFGIFVGYIVYVLYDHFVCGSILVPGWTSIMSAITIFGTIQLLLFGVFGEYLGRIYEQSKNRPLFIIQDIAQAGAVTESTSPKT